MRIDPKPARAARWMAPALTAALLLLLALIPTLRGVCDSPPEGASGAGDPVILEPPPHSILAVGGGLDVAALMQVAHGDLVKSGDVQVAALPPVAGRSNLDCSADLATALDESGARVLVVALERADFVVPAPPTDGKKRKKQEGPSSEELAAGYRKGLDDLLKVSSDRAIPTFLLDVPPPVAAPESTPPRKSRKKQPEPARDPVPEALRGACAAARGCTLVEGWAAGDPGVALLAAFDGALSFAVPPPLVSWDDDGLLTTQVLVHTAEEFHRSKTRGKDVGYWVFEPVTDSGEGEFPVLYLLHGAYDGYKAWPDHAVEQLSLLAARYGMIIVTPDGDPFGWYVDSPEEEQSQIESYFLEELIPHIEEEFSVIEGQRSICGLSMGGHGALSLALKHPGTFVSASSMSGILDLTAHPTSWQLPDRLGSLKEHPEVWEANSVTHLLAARGSDLGGLHIRFTVTTEDNLAVKDNQALKAQLEAAGTPFEYSEGPGGHTWDYWTAQLEPHVAFHAEYLSGDGVRPAPADAMPQEAPTD